MKKISIFVPTYNAGKLSSDFFSALYREARGQDNIQVIIVDSGSTDDTLMEAGKYGFDIYSIPSSEFNHGGTRNKILELSDDSEIFIFLTQDALLEPNAIVEIVKCFDDHQIAAAYGRQIPHNNATAIAQHARYFNYKSFDYVSNLSDVPSMGIKTVFMSNSFSAYRASVFKELGGFPSHTILSEDMFFAAKAVLAGYSIHYCSKAMVKHSHNYSAIEEFKRYFDIGVFHCSEPWIKENFGGAGSEGRRFIISELQYLIRNNPLLIFRAMINNVGKILGYKMGLNYKRIPKRLLMSLCMHKNYFKKELS